ncbi:hypothetical protein [Catenulispora subtropica]|uniref:Uncharacterized protein n=1 Tax=Catenulispora subtropica TaxID=450798 RepID=A0ABN2R8R2_9ACTN
MRTAEDIREHLIVTLNSMFKRPGMYGGWLAAHTVIDMLEYVDGVDEGRISVVDSNARTPERFVDERLPDPRSDIYHSLFLPRLHQRGWFRPDKLLTSAEHADLVEALELWVSEVRSQSDVIESFGTPSWAHGGWQGSPRVMVYAAADAARPMVYFVAAEDEVIVAAWAAENLFPIGLNVTTRGKELLADRRPVVG